MLNRRSIMKFIGAAPVVGPGAAKAAAAEMMASPAMAAMTALSSRPVWDGPQVVGSAAKLPPIGQLFGKGAMEQVQEWLSCSREMSDTTRGARVEGLDPDLHALKSVARVHKVRKQIERDYEATVFEHRARQGVWW